MKGNHGAVCEAVRAWVAAHTARAPDAVQVDKAHGREERREIWVVADQELGAYLAQEYGWLGVCGSGRVRRWRRRIDQSQWQHVEEVYWIAGGHLPAWEASQVLTWLRGHWEVENRVFWVRDVTYGEDRSHARMVALALSGLRAVAVNLIRHLGFRLIPDGWRVLAARPDRGLSLLLQPVAELP